MSFVSLTCLSDPSALLYSVSGFFFLTVSLKIQRETEEFSLDLHEGSDSAPSDGLLSPPRDYWPEVTCTGATGVGEGRGVLNQSL